MAQMEPLETSTTLAFHGVSYVVTVCVRDQTLEIQVELEDAPSAATASHQETCWTAQFPANYLEDLTRKTGNYKRFPVFVNMLLSAMAHRSDAVFIDLLTTADLELYRKRKMGRQGLQPRASTANANDSYDSATTSTTTSTSASQKRYLILTYAVEFDRVHYPLPLHLVDKPTPEILQRTIRRLRQEVGKSSNKTTNDEELRALREENRCLKATLASYCGREEEEEGQGNENGGDTRNPRHTGKLDLDLQHELELSMRENKELIVIYQQLREDSSAEMARLRAEIKQLKLIRQTHDGAVDHKTERERLDARRRLNDSNAAAHEALLQLQEMKTQLEETQLKNKELLRQLAIARVKAGSASHTPMATRDVAGATRAKSRGAVSSNGVAAAGNSNRPVARALRRVNSYERQFDSSDDEDVPGGGYRSSSGGRMTHGGDTATTPQRRGFRRFDPTAYQQERQRKLQQRGASPSQRGGPGPSSRPRRVSGGAAGGYTSDSSAGGYSSAGSDASRGSARSTTRGRSRVAYQHQRDAVDRLASPRSTVVPPSSQTPSRSQIPRPRSQSGSRPTAPSRARSPSPARSSNGGRTATSTALPPPPAPASQARRPLNATTRSQATAKTKSPATPKATPTSTTSATSSSHRELPRPPALLADTSLDSFSDIDDRLTALQQFLKQAKQQGSTATPPTAASPALVR